MGFTSVPVPWHARAGTLEVAEEEEEEEDPDGEGDLAEGGEALGRLHQHIHDQPQHDAVADAVAQRHEDHGDEGRDGVGIVEPVDLGHAAAHHHAHHHEGRSDGGIGDGKEQRTEEQGERETHGDDKGGESGSSALSHASGALHIGRGGRGAHAGTSRGGHRIRHQHAPHPVDLAVLIHHARLHRHGNHGADGVEDVHEEEGYHHDQHVPRADMLPLELQQDGRQRGRFGEEGIDMRHAHRDADEGRQQDSPEQSAAHVSHHHPAADGQSYKRQQHLGLVERGERHLRTRVSHDHAAVLQSDKGDEESDAHPDGQLEHVRDGVCDDLAHLEEREEHEDESLDEDGRQRELPTVAHAQADGVDEEGVDTHAGCQRKRFLGIERHHQRAYEGGQNGGGEHGAHRHPLRLERAEDTWVHGQDIGHGEKGGDTRIDLCAHLVLCGVKPE